MKLTDHVYLVGSGDFGISHPFDSNVYIVDCGKELALIDTGAGCDSERIAGNIEKDSLDISKVSRILLTHGHADHAAGAHYFQKRFGSDVCLSEAEVELVETGSEEDLSLDIAKASGLYSPEYKFQHCAIDVPLRHEDAVFCGPYTFTALHVPGHSAGSVCFLADLPEGRALFTGDTVFPEGVIGMLNCRGSELSDYRRYIHRLSGLNIDMLFPGHRVFVLSGGQGHVDQAIESLSLLQLPRNFI
jgi:glyoxylase-like metal-dependent hydrolase (beta-lactamase superfamily II)